MLSAQQNNLNQRWINGLIHSKTPKLLRARKKLSSPENPKDVKKKKSEKKG
jgi:hypothetical protein